jgi:hypothetical protein
MGSACRVPHENRDGSHASGLGSGGTKSRGFWTKVWKRPDGCWDWTSYLDKDGAGKFCTLVDGRARTFRAARYAWEQHYGPIPPGYVLLALVCWNRRCIRPSHREPVPKRDVVRWIVAMGRPVERADNRGAMCGRAILTDDQVRDIRACRGVYGAMPLLAELYGISVHTARIVAQGRTWRHLRGRPREHMPLSLLRDLVRQRQEAA